MTVAALFPWGITRAGRRHEVVPPPDPSRTQLLQSFRSSHPETHASRSTDAGGVTDQGSCALRGLASPKAAGPARATAAAAPRRKLEGESGSHSRGLARPAGAAGGGRRRPAGGRGRVVPPRRPRQARAGRRQHAGGRQRGEERPRPPAQLALLAVPQPPARRPHAHAQGAPRLLALPQNPGRAPTPSDQSWTGADLLQLDGPAAWCLV